VEISKGSGLFDGGEDEADARRPATEGDGIRLIAKFSNQTLVSCKLEMIWEIHYIFS